MGLGATWKSWWMSCVTRRRSARPPCEDPRDSASWYRNLDFLSALTCPTPSHYGIIYYRCSLWESKHRSHVTLCDHYGPDGGGTSLRPLLLLVVLCLFLRPLACYSPLPHSTPQSCLFIHETIPFVASFAISNGSSHHFFANWNWRGISMQEFENSFRLDRSFLEKVNCYKILIVIWFVYWFWSIDNLPHQIQLFHFNLESFIATW